MSRESSHLEFKQSFNFASLADYSRTMAAFANAQGGYIVFGVTDRPRTLVGLKGDAFDNMDAEQITQGLNDFLSPELKWKSTIYELGGLSFGLIYTYSCTRKPVVASKNTGKHIKEGEIYYRYHARTQVIKHPELREIIEQIRETESKLWMQHLSSIARIGVQDAAVLDLVTGEARASGGTLVIDESLLPKIKFIREGTFNETAGSPAIRIVGEATPIGSASFLPSKRVIVPKGIYLPEIMTAFLSRQKVREPREYIKAICYEASAFLPVYYFIYSAKITISEAIELAESVQSRQSGQARLLVRLRKNEQFRLNLTKTKSNAYQSKKKYRSQIQAKDFKPQETASELRYALEAIRTLSQSQIDLVYLASFLQDWFERFYFGKQPNISDAFRKSVCHLDYMLYQPKCKP